MSTWSKATYEMAADVLAKWAYPMVARQYANQEDAFWVRTQVQCLVSKFSIIFANDNKNFDDEKFTNAINDKGSQWADALEQLSGDEEFNKMMNSMLLVGDGGLTAFTLEGMVNAWLKSQQPEDDKGL